MTREQAGGIKRCASVLQFIGSASELNGVPILDFANVHHQEALYGIDCRWVTWAGGTVGMDMATELIARTWAVLCRESGRMAYPRRDPRS